MSPVLPREERDAIRAVLDATTMTDADEVLICTGCGTEQRTTPTGRVTTTTPDPSTRKVTGL